MLQAKVAAARINEIFQSCRNDLETISKLILDGHTMESGLAAAVNDAWRDSRVTALFKDFISRSPYYYQIRLMDPKGKALLGTSAVAQTGFRTMSDGKPLLGEITDGSKNFFYLSSVIEPDVDHRYFIYFAYPVVSRANTLIGTVIIDIDFNKVIDLVSQIRVAKHGHAFLVDVLGRTIAHPRYQPYQNNFTKYDDPRLRELVVSMINGESGWVMYNLEGEKAAAYAPVDATRWSVGVEVPIEDFVSEARGLRITVIQVVLGALFLSVAAAGFISYHILKPIKRLATATELIATGDLSQKISVQSNDELGMLTQSFNHMVQSLNNIQNELIASEKLISIGRLSVAVAHEIRNPLNAMKGAIVVMQRRRAADSLVMEYTDLIFQEINRLSEFVTDFLRLAKPAHPRKVPTDINGLIQNTSALFKDHLYTQQIHLYHKLDMGLAPVPLDAQQIEQVLVNLIVNAADAMPHGGHITLSSRLHQRSKSLGQSDWVEVAVEDNGIGIPPSDLKNIFDPFFSTKENGTGLGLAISIGIIQAHGGTMHVLSEPPGKTRVAFELPLDNKSNGPGGPA
jgi:signal transduction histidine kinase